MTKYSRWDLLRMRACSAIAARRARAVLRDVNTCALFVGYPRSGHTLVGALVDAHTQAVIAHELDALRFLGQGWPPAHVWSLILENARQFGARGRKWQGYAYKVPGGAHGRGDPCLVVGDKKGGWTTRRLAADPGLLDRVDRGMAARLRLVHVVRNPYDIVATRHRHTGADVDQLIARTVGLIDAVGGIAERAGHERFLTVRHEDVVTDPRNELRRLAAFLGLTPHTDWIESAASIVFASPRRSRTEIQWTSEREAQVIRAIERHPFLSGYSLTS